MRKLFFKGLTCLGILFILISCKKETINNSGKEFINFNTPYEFLNWFTKRFNNNQIIINGLNDSISNPSAKLILEPVWSEAKNYKRGDSIISEIPITNGNIVFSKNPIDPKSFDYSKAGSVTSLLFIKTDSTVRGVLMTIIGDETYLRGNTQKLKNNSFRQKEKDFSGDVLYHTTHGLFINGFRYYNGIVVGIISQIEAPKFNTKKKFQLNTTKDYLCETYKQETAWRQCNGGCVYWTETYYFQVCSFVGGSNDSGPTGGCGGLSRDLMQSVDWTPCNDVDIIEENPTEIINRVTDPCLRNLVDNLIEDNISGEISKIISRLHKDIKVKIVYTDAEVTSNYKPAQIGPISLKDGIYPITLSRLHLKETTKENVTSVIIHEIIHAFFTYTNIGNPLESIEHDMIASNYIKPMAHYLTQLYGISEKDASALA